jgi:glycosyltransferase involved in cell wall biosynthesis
MPSFMSALDLLCLPSHSEAFPNVLGEAMACEVPCIATRVGDVPQLLGDTGWVVSVKNLATALRSALTMSQADLAGRGRQARRRIAECYGIDNMVRSFHEMY